jgi:hypothetical protein
MKTSPLVQFGAVTFDGTSIQSAEVVEQFNPLATELPISTFDLTIFSTDADLAIINPAGDYAGLNSSQPLAVYELVGDTTVFIGQFYLATWTNPSDTQIKLSCVDVLGLLDKLDYDGGMWTTPTAASAMIKTMLAGIGVACDIDPALDAVMLTGWIPICSYREALQQIAFAAGAYVITARMKNLTVGQTPLAGTIDKNTRCGVVGTGQSHVWGRRFRSNIWTSNVSGMVVSSGIALGVSGAGQSRVWSHRFRVGAWESLVGDFPITKAQKGADQSLTLKPQVTGVEITAHNYVALTDSMELFNGVLPAGTNKIPFSEPVHDLSITGATITDSGANYATISVAVAGTVLLTGLKYADTTSVSGVYMTGSPTSNILTVDQATLISSSNGAAIAQLMYSYYQERYWQKMKLYASAVATGNAAVVDTLYGMQLRGMVEKMDLDLAGGFTSACEVIGNIS